MDTARPMLLLTVVVLAMSSAGCTRPAPTATPTLSSTVAAACEALVLEQCRNVSGTFSVSDAEARSWLPDGFRTVPADAAGTTTVFIVGRHCDHMTYDGVAQGPMAAVYAELSVVPAATFSQTGITD